MKRLHRLHFENGMSREHAILFRSLVLACWIFGSFPFPNIASGTPIEPELHSHRGDSSSADTIDSRNGEPKQRDYPALANLLRVSDMIYSGGEPNSDDAFSSLVRLGVKTVVSVDGAKPEVEMARKYGLRYVHIPIGYDGVGQAAGLSLASLVATADGPFYIHCHHGRHRGPAAAAVAWIASGGSDGKGALEILERAGTSRDYAGLWRDVENYNVPGDVDLPALVEVAEIDSLDASMAKIGRAYDKLERCDDANGLASNRRPDLLPAQQALLLKEALRESARHPSDGFGAEFTAWLSDAATLAQNLEDSLRSKRSADEVARAFRALERSCNRCHKKYRN
jgi:protein tyrosine phosphatase (PTP) superfamily phosphohydrolase (DUF442 family)